MFRYFLISLILPLVAFAKSTRFDFRDAGSRNVIEFVSDGTLEKIVGLSTSFSGWMELDPERLSDSFKGEFEVDVRTFTTGIESRNDQMKEKFLNAGEFPVAVFTVTRLVSISRAKLGDQQPITAKLEGILKMKGMQKIQSILAKFVYFKESELTKQRLGGNLLKVSANFDLDLSQFNVSLPDNQRARLTRFLQMSVDAVGSDQPPILTQSAPAEKALEAKGK
jgi:polyisoprenoid-binding protein YceI